MRLTRLPGEYAVARATPSAPVPPGILDGAGFRTVARTDEELSVVAPVQDIHAMDKVDGGWSCFKLHGPFEFDEIGIINGLSAPLKERKIGVFVVSTFDTDYILIKQADADAAAAAWVDAGHEVLD